MGTNKRTIAEPVSAADFLPTRVNLTSLHRSAQGCRGCELYKNATQVVFGSGKRKSRVMLVGEIPGDEEDRRGEPFVGPAGRLLDEALVEAGIDRNEVYVTNVVKHFRWEPRGKRRLHKKPSSRHISACLPWLEAEVECVEPAVIVCLGATAAQALIDREFRITRQRGVFVQSDWSMPLLATYHPSAVLRSPDPVGRRQMREELVEDLRRVADHLAAHAS